MLKFSKRVDYGLMLLSRLNNKAEAASAREIAASYNLPAPMIANILKSLTAAGVLNSTRGAQGGYELARSAAHITLAEIVEALEGPFSLVDCISAEIKCRYSPVCPTHDPIQVVHHRFHEFMSGLMLADIIGGPRPLHPIRTDGDEETYLS